MILRLLVFFLGLALFSSNLISAAAAQEESADTKLASEHLLPSSTKAWFSVPDFDRLTEQFDKTQFGRLAEDELLKPFIESLKGQFSDWLNKQNVRMGVKIEDLQSVRSGEICVAGILQQQAEEEEDDSKLGRGSHGLVLLVDVTDTEDRARELMKKVDADFKARGAKQGQSEIHGVNVVRWTVQRPKMVVKQRSTYHAIADGWLLISDNDNIFREILRRLVNVKKPNGADTLASQAAFQQISKNTKLEKVAPEARWFVDPFGYLELAQAIEKEDQYRKERKNDWVRILKEEGFSVLHGIGGQISFATGEHEMLHRTFIYAPRKVGGVNEKRFFGLFDFENKYGHELSPRPWVPANISAHFTACWDMTQAFENVGGLVDSFMKEEGAWENIVAGLKEDMNVDVPKLVASFNNQITVISSTARPINTDSERVAICVPIKENEKGLLDVIKRAIGGEKAYRGLKILGKEVLLMEVVEEEIPTELDIWEADEDEEGEEDADGDNLEEFELFAKKYLTVVHGHFVMANNKDFLKEIIRGKPKSLVAKSSDYITVQTTLDELTDPDKTSFRHFGRVDRAMETNYEMLRQGKMGMSNTMLARILNRVMQPPADTGEVNIEPREQKLDGSKLPADYDKHVGRYFGPMGWVVESDTDGWRLTGCMLKKKQVDKVVQRLDDTSKR